MFSQFSFEILNFSGKIKQIFSTLKKKQEKLEKTNILKKHFY